MVKQGDINQVKASGPYSLCENDDYIDGHKGQCSYDCWVNNKASVGALVSSLCVGLLMWFDKCVELEDAWDNWHNHQRSLGGCLEHLP